MAPDGGYRVSFARMEPTKEPFRALSLSAALTVRDLDASLAWYRDILGLAVERNHERGGKLMAVSMRAGDVRILLGQDDGARGLDRVKGEGFSLQFTTDQDIDELANGLRSKGVKLDTEPVDTPWGARVFRVTDPDGFRFAISSVPRVTAG